MMKLNTIGGMVATVAVGVALVQGCISAPSVGDPYFTQVKPTANVYASFSTTTRRRRRSILISAC